MVEHLGQHGRGVRSADLPQPIDDIRYLQRAVVDLTPFAFGIGPQERDGLGHVADIVAAHGEQHRIDPFLGHRSNLRRLYRRDVERAGQRSKRDAPVGVGRFPEIIADQLQLRIARPGVGQVIEQLGKGAHRSATMREARKGCLVEADRQRGEDRFAIVGGVFAVQRFVHMIEASAGRGDMAGH